MVLLFHCKQHTPIIPTNQLIIPTNQLIILEYSLILFSTYYSKKFFLNNRRVPTLKWVPLAHGLKWVRFLYLLTHPSYIKSLENPLWQSKVFINIHVTFLFKSQPAILVSFSHSRHIPCTTTNPTTIISMMVVDIPTRKPATRMRGRLVTSMLEVSKLHWSNK